MSNDSTTKDRILDAAETLYAANGFAGTSLRAIMKEAGVNMAAVHYHFGSRASLVEAVISRRATPVNQERLKLLDQLEAAHPDEQLPLDGVLAAFFHPVFRMLEDNKRAGSAFPHLMNRLIMEPDEEFREVIGRVFADVARRFIAAIGCALPGVPPEVLFWRMHFMLGAMVFSLTVPHAQGVDNVVRFSPTVPSSVEDELIRFASAGMQAPATKGSR